MSKKKGEEMGTEKGMELYMSIVNIVDYLALNNLSTNDQVDLYGALNSLLRVEANKNDTTTDVEYKLFVSRIIESIR